MLTAEEIESHLVPESGSWWWNTGLFQIRLYFHLPNDYGGFLYLNLRAVGVIHNVTLVEVHGYTRKAALEHLASGIASFDWSGILGIGPMVEEWVKPSEGQRGLLERVVSEEDFLGV